MDEHILKPLGAARDTVCMSDALDQARLNAGQARRVGDTYAPVANALGLPPCTLRPVPASEGAIVREATHGHLDRLREELRLCQPERIVTLGNAALRVAKLLLVDPQPAPGSKLTSTAYGEPIQAQFEGRRITWLPLVHPRSGERTPPWPGVHRRWEQSLAERPG